MAIIDYPTLRAAAQAYHGRTDTRSTTAFETFVSFAEDRIFNGAGRPGGSDPVGSSPLRVAAMESIVALTTSDTGEANLPARCLGVSALSVDGGRLPLEYMGVQSFERWKNAGNSGDIRRYTTIGNVVRIAPVAAASLSAVCYIRPAALTVENPSSPILTAYPMIYLSAVLFEMFTWLAEDGIAVAHLARLRSQIEGANRVAQDMSLLAGSGVAMFEPIC